MNRQLTLLISACIVLSVSLTTVFACPPDCGDVCYEWDGYTQSCELVAECAEWTDCPNGGGCCDCIDCYCENNDYWCDECEYCYDCGCECAVVSSVSGISGPYYVGDTATVTASLSHTFSPLSPCRVNWGGAGFSNHDDTSALATFYNSGANQYITAKTTCQHYTWGSSSLFTVVELSQFNADPTKFPKCQNMPISRDDFVIVTNPTGYESQVEVSDLSTATPGTFTAHAKLWGKPTPLGLAADYTVIASGVTSLVSGWPCPDISGESVSGSSGWHTRTVSNWPWADTYERAQVTWSGGKFWEQIGEWFNVPPGSSVTATWARAWTISVTVGLGIKTGVPGFAEVTFQGSISGGWQSTTTLSQSIPAPTTPNFTYDIRYYQKVVGIQETVTKETATSPNGPWSSLSADANTLSACGLASFNTAIWKKCP